MKIIVLRVGRAMLKDMRVCLLNLGVELPRVGKIMRKLKMQMHTTRAVSSILHARRDKETAHPKLD